jgi:putative ABC transport system permease protein
MVREYLRIAVRQLRKEKVYSFITIFGLGLGLACVLCILLFVNDELSYDQYHSKKDRIFRVIQGGDSEEQSSSLPFPSGPTLQNDFPDMVEQQVRLFNFQASTLSVVYEENGVKKPFNEPHFFFADSGYFKMFDHQFLKGNPGKALSGPGYVVITKTTAERYFGTTDAIGKIISFEGKYPLMVNGIVEDVPSNSHFTFDFLASMTSLPALGFPIPEKNWYWNPVWTYVLLKDPSDRALLQDQLHAFVQKYYHPAVKDETELNLQAVTNIYLHSKSEYEIGVMSDIRNIKLFSIICLVILLIAIINFINLSTARATDRFKEIGVRKVNGASKQRLLLQFTFESVMIALLALLIAGALSVLLLPSLNHLAGKNFTPETLFRPTVVASMVAIGIAAGLISGIYPALYLASLNPVSVLRSSGNAQNSKSLFRKALTVFQFAISTVLIVVTLVIYNQIEYMKGTPMGFDREQIVVLPVQRLSLVPNYESFKERILTNPAIVGVSCTNTLIGKDYQSSNYKKEGDDTESFYPVFFARNDFAKTLGIRLLAGRDFNKEITAPGYYAIINNSLCKTWGWTPSEAVGKVIDGTLEGKVTIVGVTEDYHFASLKQAIQPMIVMQADFAKSRDFFTRFVLVRIRLDRAKEAMDFLRANWEQTVTESPFDYFFLNEKLNTVYEREDQLNRIATVFSGFAILIGCLGLYGLSLYTFRKRKKEVAIRKVLGASERTIVRLFTTDFLKLVILGFLIGTPAAWFLSDQWLSEFSYRLVLGYTHFTICLAILIVLALSTILFQTIKASLINPSTVLRNE